MKVFLFILLLLAVSMNVEGAECRVDSDCSNRKLCVDGDCLNSNHRSGRVVITDRNNGEICIPECSPGQQCFSGSCVVES